MIKESLEKIKKISFAVLLSVFFMSCGKLEKINTGDNSLDSQKITISTLDSLLKVDGGFTYDENELKLAPELGYVVSLDGYEKKFPANQFSATDISSFIKNNVATLINQPNVHIGGWIDGDTIYLDLSIILNDEEKAKGFAFEQGQKAIFNLETGKTVFLEKT